MIIALTRQLTRKKTSLSLPFGRIDTDRWPHFLMRNHRISSRLGGAVSEAFLFGAGLPIKTLLKPFLKGSQLDTRQRADELNQMYRLADKQLNSVCLLGSFTTLSLPVHLGMTLLSQYSQPFEVCLQQLLPIVAP